MKNLLTFTSSSKAIALIGTVGQDQKGFSGSEVVGKGMMGLGWDAD